MSGSSTRSRTRHFGSSEPNGSWKTICTCRRAWSSLAPRSVTRSAPRKTTSPEVGRGACRMDRASVDLPEPVSPTTPRVSPGHTSNETPETACTVPVIGPLVVRNSCTRSLTWRRGAVLAGMGHLHGVPAGPAVAGLVLGQRRRGGPAVVGGAAAAGRERAAWRGGGPVGRTAADHRERGVRGPLEPRDRLEQGLGVGHPDAGEQPCRRGLLDDPAEQVDGLLPGLGLAG